MSKVQETTAARSDRETSAAGGRPGAGIMAGKSMLGIAACALLVLGGFNDDVGCGPPPLTKDPGFDIWCGKKLCAWSVSKGKIKRVPTWHRSEYGVELDGDPVVLSQLLVTAARCLQLNLQADKDDGVSLHLELDFMDDGTSEYNHALTSDDFTPVGYKVTSPTWYKKVRVIVRKQGAGRAVLTNLRIASAGGCSGPPLTMNDRPLGAGCDTGSQCKNGHCPLLSYKSIFAKTNSPRVCSACANDSHCKAGQACGVDGAPTYDVALKCVSVGSRSLGERCESDAECATEVCCKGACSQCCQGKGCSSSTACKQRQEWISQGESNYLPLPWQCSPGQGVGQAKAPCIHDDDCQSYTCQSTGELKICLMDGRRCQTDEDCPGKLWCWKMGLDKGQCK